MRFVAILVPVLALLLVAGCASDKAPTTPVPATPTVASMTSAPVDPPIFSPPPTSIGEATMLPDGTLVVSNPHQVSRTAPTDPKYSAWIAHVGGMKPGQVKNMPAWPDGCPSAGVSLRLGHDSYAVTELP
jgi:hypothetical protein